MNRKGSAIVVLIVIIVVLVAAGAIWYYVSQKPVATQPTNIESVASSTTPSTTSQQIVGLPSFSFSCPQSSTTTLTAYENQQMGVAFCYPSGLIVATSTITWPNSSSTVWGSEPGNLPGQIAFWMLHEQSAMVVQQNVPGGVPLLFDDLASCDAAGSNGESWCAFPTPSQITEGTNANGFNYVLFRHDIDSSNSSAGYGTTVVSDNNAGPSAFIPLIGQDYLAFATVNMNYVSQPAGYSSLPSYVDKDLLEILNTVSIMPQQYTGVGLTLTNSSSGKIAVYNVIADSPALAAGIKAGDVITGINGTSTATMSVDSLTNLLDTATGTVMLDVQESSSHAPTAVSLTPATFVVSGSDLGAMYEKPF